MRKILQIASIGLVASLLSVPSGAQTSYNKTPAFLKQNSVWAMYANSKYNFNNGTTGIVNLPGAKEGCASVAHPVTGELLFYSDGGHCYTANNMVMPNGAGLFGNAGSGYSTAQGVTIVPMPGDSQKYYLFSLRTANSPIAATDFFLYYSIVDMSLNGGAGDVVAASKNTLLDGTGDLGEAMLAVQGNNCDVWLVLHKRNVPVFKSYQITSAGINTTPVVSTTGAQIQGTTTVGFSGFSFEQEAYEQATLTVSPDRTKLVVSCEHIGSNGLLPLISSTGRTWGGLLCNFNANTGVVSDAILLEGAGQFSAAFSPNNNKLYYGTLIAGSLDSEVYQIDISSIDSATIMGTKTLVGTTATAEYYLSLRLYNDTIYVMNGGMLSLDRINTPNASGAACNYQSSAIVFPAALSLGYSLPAEVVGAAAPDSVYAKVLDTTICNNWTTGLVLSASGNLAGASYLWQDNSTQTTFTANAAGTYWVQYFNDCHYHVDTFVIAGSDIDPVISQIGSTLSTASGFSSYQWYLNNVAIPGATSASYTAIEDGDYKVEVSDGVCSATSEVVTVTGLSTAEMEGIKSSVIVYPNPASSEVQVTAASPVNLHLTSLEGKLLKTALQTDTLSVSDLSSGIYLLHVTDKYGRLLKVEKLILEQKK